MEYTPDAMNEISEEDLENIGGGRAVENKGDNDAVKGLANVGKVMPDGKRINYLDGKGLYHIICVECGKEIKSWKPAPGSVYAVGPQVCDTCNAKRKNRQKRR